MKRIIRHLIKQQRFPKSTVILADEAQLLLLLCVCVWDSCCSQWYNLFIPLNLISLRVRHSLALTLPLPHVTHQITGCSHSLTLFILRHQRRSVERQHSAGCIMLCSDVAAA